MTHVSYEIFSRSSWNKRKRLQDINSVTQKIREQERFYGLVYLKLALDMREYDKEIKQMQEAIDFARDFGGKLGFLGNILSSFYSRTPMPKRSKEEIEFDNRCYEMWDELDKITILID